MANQPHVETARIKIAVVGYTRSGKTSVVSRLVAAGFTSSYSATLGVDYKTADHASCDDTNVHTSTIFADIGGDARYVYLEDQQVEHADAVILVFNLWWQGEMDDYGAKIKKLQKVAPVSTPIVLVGTHLDRLHHPIDGQDAEIAHAKAQHAIDKGAEASAFAGKTYLVSCKTNDGFDDLQMALACIRKTRWQFHLAAKKAAVQNARTALQRDEIASTDLAASVEARLGDRYAHQSRWSTGRVLIGMVAMPGSSEPAIIARGALAAVEAINVAKSERRDAGDG
jgi:50S ribosomal subunit-associated GTPase HflX